MLNKVCVAVFGSLVIYTLFFTVTAGLQQVLHKYLLQDWLMLCCYSLGAIAALLVILGLRPQILRQTAVTDRCHLAWFMASILLVAILSYSLHHVDSFEQHVFIRSQSVWILLPLFVVIMPIFEECLFREYLLQKLIDARLPQALAILTSSLLWAALHYQYPPFLLCYIFLLGCVFAVMRQYSKTILSAIVLHGFFNLSQILWRVYN